MQTGRKIHFHKLNFIKKVFLRYPNKRVFPHQKRVKKHSQSPNISLLSIIFLFINNFRRHILRSSTQKFQFLIIRNTNREPKIDNFYSFLRINYNIIRFHIPMNNIILMQIHKSLSNLPNNLLSFPINQFPIRYIPHIILQRLLPNILHNHQNLSK